MADDNNQYEVLLKNAGCPVDPPEEKKGAAIDEEMAKIINELENESWYHGALPLEDVMGLITTPGDFLLRGVETKGGRGLTPCLTVRVESHTKDFAINKEQEGKETLFTIDKVHKAPSVIALVQKHYDDKIPVSDEIILVRPVPKQAWELSKQKITKETKIGEGAFGEVWKGTLEHIGAITIPVAIKVTKMREENRQVLQEMHKEARLMRQYKHANIVAFYGIVIENDNVMIVMELVKGGGLHHYLKSNSIGIADRCSYAFDVSLGLYYLHSKGCIHRDLACRNCLIDSQKNIVKISDFGLSKQAEKHVMQTTERIPVRWQAPEVISKFVYTRECDVYSYGILVWEIFNDGKVPFEEHSNRTVRQRLSDPKFRPSISKEWPEEVRIIVAACWLADPRRRPVMKDVAWILKKFIRHNIAENNLNKTPPIPANVNTVPQSSNSTRVKKERDDSVRVKKERDDSVRVKKERDDSSRKIRSRSVGKRLSRQEIMKKAVRRRSQMELPRKNY